jgi:hypothetical protein
VDNSWLHKFVGPVQISDMCQIKPSSKDECQYRASKTCLACGARVCGKHSTDRNSILQCRDCAFPQPEKPEATALDEYKAENAILRDTIHNVHNLARETTGKTALGQIGLISEACRKGLARANVVTWSDDTILPPTY